MENIATPNFPNAESLSAPIIKNIPCNVDGCSKILPHMQALRFHLIKTHRILKNEQDRLFFQHKKCTPTKYEIFYCPQVSCPSYCIKGFSSLKLLREHFLRQHSARNFFCEICKCSFSLERDKKRHMKLCLRNKSCISCNVAFSSLDNLNDHYKITNHNKIDVSFFNNYSIEKSNVDINSQNMEEINYISNINNDFSPIKQNDVELSRQPIQIIQNNHTQNSHDANANFLNYEFENCKSADIKVVKIFKKADILQSKNLINSKSNVFSNNASCISTDINFTLPSHNYKDSFITTSENSILSFNKNISNSSQENEEIKVLDDSLKSSNNLSINNNNCINNQSYNMKNNDFKILHENIVNCLFQKKNVDNLYNEESNLNVFKNMANSDGIVNQNVTQNLNYSLPTENYKIVTQDNKKNCSKNTLINVLESIKSDSFQNFKFQNTKNLQMVSNTGNINFTEKENLFHEIITSSGKTIICRLKPKTSKVNYNTDDFKSNIDVDNNCQAFDSSNILSKCVNELLIQSIQRPKFQYNVKAKEKNMETGFLNMSKAHRKILPKAHDKRGFLFNIVSQQNFYILTDGKSSSIAEANANANKKEIKVKKSRRNVRENEIYKTNTKSMLSTSTIDSSYNQLWQYLPSINQIPSTMEYLINEKASNIKNSIKTINDSSSSMDKDIPQWTHNSCKLANSGSTVPEFDNLLNSVDDSTNLIEPNNWSDNGERFIEDDNELKIEQLLYLVHNETQTYNDGLTTIETQTAEDLESFLNLCDMETQTNINTHMNECMSSIDSHTQTNFINDNMINDLFNMHTQTPNILMTNSEQASFNVNNYSNRNTFSDFDFLECTNASNNEYKFDDLLENNKMFTTQNGPDFFEDIHKKMVSEEGTQTRNETYFESIDMQTQTQAFEDFFNFASIETQTYSKDMLDLDFLFHY